MLLPFMALQRILVVIRVATEATKESFTSVHLSNVCLCDPLICVPGLSTPLKRAKIDPLHCHPCPLGPLNLNLFHDRLEALAGGDRGSGLGGSLPQVRQKATHLTRILLRDVVYSGPGGGLQLLRVADLPNS